MNRELIRRMSACALLAVCAATASALPAQTFTTLHSFAGPEREDPYSAVIQGVNGDFYGATYYGGANGSGTVFRVTPGGVLVTLYSFCSEGGSVCSDGMHPYAGLVQATDGNLYGNTQGGGALNAGTIFKITPGGALTTLYSFCSLAGCADGTLPYAPLVQADNGKFYGTTAQGGAFSEGTVFEITQNGQFTTLYSFNGTTDGGSPNGLIQAADGDFYGTTSFGGTSVEDAGTVFKITPGGTLRTLYSFCPQFGCPDGQNPSSGLIQAANGDFYGTTFGGQENAVGTVFAITSTGALTTLHNFCSQGGNLCTDGSNPVAGLIQDAGGNLYGTTEHGGASGNAGTVFEISSFGALTTLYTFCAQGGSTCPDGKYPEAGLIESTNGAFYGTTLNGGSGGEGTIFSLSVGLHPFVEARLTAGRTGETVQILGTDLTGATSVSFNGTPAVFEALAPSLIKTTVPAGATTGNLQVVTPRGTLSTNVPFQVLP